MRLTGHWKYLLLRRSDDLNGHSVHVVDTTEEAIHEWDWTTRASPIFPFDNQPTPDLSSSVAHACFFIGPLDPGVVDIDLPAFATLGTYNLIVIARDTDRERAKVLRLLEGHPSVRWECWQVRCGVIQKVFFGRPRHNQPSPAKVKRASVPPALQAAEEENATLTAAAITKARQYFPSVAKDLEVFAGAFHEHLQHANGGDNGKLSWLVNVNAHLSRYTSQAFSGVSPIASTECHFWSHSLLGVGTACQALINIRKFAQKAIGDADWIDCLDRLGRTPLPSNWTPLMERSAQEASAWTDLEAIVGNSIREEQEAAKSRHPDEKARLPLIMCFSGRDGFRSTPFSLTAPLEVISGSNTPGWTPLTLSHEICHVWMGGIIETIFPIGLDPTSATPLNDLIAGAQPPRTVLDDVRVAVYFSFNLLFREELELADRVQSIPADREKTWVEVVERYALQVNETLTHVLDFQFFYQMNETRYIEFIWSSWDVIPNIKDRLSSYLLRSACALLSENLSNERPIETTLDRLKVNLEALQKKMPRAHYLADALGILERDRQVLESRLENRELLVRLAKTLFANREILSRLDKEHRSKGKAYSKLRPLVLDYQQILNPLRFVAQFSDDRAVDRCKSLWILTKIAFMQDPDETFA